MNDTVLAAMLVIAAIVISLMFLMVPIVLALIQFRFLTWFWTGARDAWFKNKKMNHARQDKLHKEGRDEQTTKEPSKRDINDFLIKKFMK